MTWYNDQLKKWLEKPYVDYCDGPVYHGNSEEYYSNLGDFLDTMYDDERTDLSGEVVFPCRTDKVHTPNLINMIEDSWQDEVEDYDFDLPLELINKINELQVEIEKYAPTVWYPTYEGRLKLNPYPLTHDSETGMVSSINEQEGK